MQILTILCIVSIIFVISLFLFLIKIYKDYKDSKYVKSFVDYIAVLEYIMNKSYEIIHKDRILLYSIEGIKLKDEEFSAITHDFTKLVIKLMGSTLRKEFLRLYGSEETFIFNLVEYFNNRYEEDEIRKQSFDNFSNDNSEG